MNTVELKVSLTTQPGKYRQRIASIAEDKLLFITNKKDELLGKIRIKVDTTKEELKKLIDKI